MPGAKYFSVVVAKAATCSPDELAQILEGHQSAFCESDTPFNERPFGRRYTWGVGAQTKTVSTVAHGVQKIPFTVLTLMSMYPIRRAKLRGDLNVIMPGWDYVYGSSNDTSKKDAALAFKKYCCSGAPIIESMFWEENVLEISEQIAAHYRRFTSAASTANSGLASMFDAACSSTKKPSAAQEFKASSPEVDDNIFN